MDVYVLSKSVNLRASTVICARKTVEKAREVMFEVNPNTKDIEPMTICDIEMYGYINDGGDSIIYQITKCSLDDDRI